MTNIRRLQDVQIGDIDLVETYRDTFNNNSVETAQGLINTNTLRSYVLQAEWMNDVKEKIEVVEGHKITECDDVFISETEKFQFNVDEFLYVNEYDDNTQYYKNNFVLYETEIYFCLADSLNNLPTNTTYWLKIGLKGEKGQYDLGLVYRGFWNEAVSYNRCDLVSHNNNLYIARQSNIDIEPMSNNQGQEGLNFLNDSLFLDNDIYLNGFDKTWLLLANPNELSKIYDSPDDYYKLPARSIFFQKL